MKKSFKPFIGLIILLTFVNILNTGQSIFAATTTVSIPARTTTISKRAFEGDTSIISVAVPDTVKTIGSRAFASCTSLREVHFGKKNDVKIADDAFADCKDFLCFFVYPGTSIEEYALAHGFECAILSD
ncbi:MAG: leucine-rich repeat protein [Blautia sp.]|nr:leucine-rich repeat protein [Blautia sp.]